MNESYLIVSIKYFLPHLRDLSSILCCELTFFGAVGRVGLVENDILLPRRLFYWELRDIEIELTAHGFELGPVELVRCLFLGHHHVDPLARSLEVESLWSVLGLLLFVALLFDLSLRLTGF